MAERRIPTHTHRQHLDKGMDQWRGDCERAIRVCAKKAPRLRFIDINFQVCLDDDMALHSGTAKKNGYKFILVGDGPERRKMTQAELTRPVAKWHARDIVRWRRTEKEGRSYESKVRPMRFEEAVLQAKKLKVTICPELKSPAFATSDVSAKRMRATAVRLNATVFPMTLASMNGWRLKMKNFHEAGFQTALLAHKARKPADFDKWSPFIDRVWGRFSARPA